ncbi:MAG: hypothetical protein K1X67_04930 [Fimbriimonadaceae bacterium]|nr:hypothetical protein [Fimbriimonadaceae bacterium]
MRWLHGILVLAFGAVSMCAEAQPWANGIYIPGPGMSMPNYWSGTNCRASGWAQVGEPIYAAELKLNGVVVNNWLMGDDPEEEPPMNFSLAAMFDSSHFANGTPVEVTYRIWSYPTGWQEASSGIDPLAQNMLMMYEHPDDDLDPDAAPLVSQLMYGKNYLLALVNGGSWSETDYFNTLDGSNAVFYAGHGTPYDHDDAWTPTGHMLTSEYYTHRVSQKGSGIPPFNTGAPPVNFCHLLACNCGDTNGFITVCYPYYMAWGGPWMENQALMAYGVYVLLKQLAQHAYLIWSKLAEGRTAWKTQQWFNVVWLEENPEQLVVSDDGESERFMKPGDLALYCNYNGDHGAMRLKTVYTGTNTDPIGWYMPL